MRISRLLPTLKFSALCLASITPALSQDSIPVFTIVDFEGKLVQSTLGTYGGAYADNSELANDSVTYGNSLLTTFSSHESPDSAMWVASHREESGTALKLGYQLGTVMLGCGGTCEYPPHVGVSVGFSSESDPIELSGATHITFWAKGRDSLTVHVELKMRDSVQHAANYAQAFVIDTTWKKYSIKLEASEDFKLPDWAPKMEFDGSRVNLIAFNIRKSDNAAHPDNALFLDDIQIVNWELSYVTSIFRHGRSAGVSRSLRGRLTGDMAVVRVPANLSGKTGVIEALDARGKKVAQAAFGPLALDVSLKIPAASAKSAGLYFRAVTK